MWFKLPILPRSPIGGLGARPPPRYVCFMAERKALRKARSTRTRPAVEEDGAREVIDLRGYVPFYITTISNTWSRGASKVYLAHFGIGVLDWAMISTLAMEPFATMQRISQFCAADKAAVSRSIAGLEKKAIVKSAATGKDTRRRTLQLTRLGYDLHDKIMALALKREKLLLKGLEADELELMTRLLHKMDENLSQLQKWDSVAVIKCTELRTLTSALKKNS